MGVRDGPPDVLSRQAQLFGQIVGNAVAKRGRKRTQVGGDEDERSRAVVERDDAMIQAVMHLGGHARTVTAQHLRRLRRDVDLDHRRAKFRGLQAAESREHEAQDVQQNPG